jgi:hypothetical protein
VGFAVDGSMRYANTTDIESLGLSGTQAIDRATRNVLDGALVGLEPAGGEANVWHLRAERGYPGAVLARGADALRKVSATSGIKDLVCALSTDQEIVIADLAQPSAIDALMQIARPIGRPVPPLSLGCVLLSGGSEGTWHELPSPSTELFVSLAAELRDLYPDATVVLPSQRHDGRGNSFWVAEWELNAGRFVLPVHMDVLLVSPPRGHKRAQTLPRVWNDVRQVVSIMSTTPHTARHFVVDVADARLMYRSIERLPLARTLGSESR